MEPLSSFAIIIAAGIALGVYNQSQGTVKSEMKRAFKKALKKWCRNFLIRRRKKNEIRSKLQELFETPKLIADIKSKGAELSNFFKIYEEILSQYATAYNYIKEIRDEDRFQ